MLPTTPTRWYEMHAAVARDFALPESSMHGPDHWARVGRNGLELAAITGACPLTVGLFALVRHDMGETSSQVTVGTCWDADRLDLPRVGVEPESKYFSTQAGKQRVRQLTAKPASFHLLPLLACSSCNRQARIPL